MWTKQEAALEIQITVFGKQTVNYERILQWDQLFIGYNLSKGGTCSGDGRKCGDLCCDRLRYELLKINTQRQNTFQGITFVVNDRQHNNLTINQNFIFDGKV